MEAKIEKALLNVKELCEYLGIGETKARELLTKTNNNFTVRLGNRLYANKIQLDKWIHNQSGNHVENRRRKEYKWEKTIKAGSLGRVYTRERTGATKQGQQSMVM